MGVTAYRYTHRAEEVWSGDTFQGLSAQTDDNGKKHAIHIWRDGAALAVERNARPDILSPATFDRGVQRDDPVRTTLLPQLLPSTHWNVRQVRQAALVNTQTGSEARVQVSVLGRETIRTANSSIDATRYRYTGDLVMDQWFNRGLELFRFWCRRHAAPSRTGRGSCRIAVATRWGILHSELRRSFHFAFRAQERGRSLHHHPLIAPKCVTFQDIFVVEPRAVPAGATAS